MIVKIVSLPRNGYPTLDRKVLVARCDECFDFFSTEYTARRCSNKNHFCSYRCQKKSQQAGGAFSNHLKETFVEVFGVENPSQATSVQVKREQTFRSRYGVKSGFNLPHVKHGTPDVVAKAFATKKKNGMLKTSGPETQFYHLLVERFGTRDVERWVTINGWSIDVHIKSLDVFVQFDGIFWHGLDRPITEIRSSSRPVDHQIVRKWETDRDQEKWFTDQQLCLVRVTDTELNQLGSDIVDVALHRATICKRDIQ